MYLIKAIPIARGIGLDTLSYWSSKNVVSGSIIRVPLRKRKIGAIVISCESALESKSEIRGADFSVKKITDTHARSIIFPQFFKTAEQMARYYACSVGSILFELLPSAILSKYEKLSQAK